MSSTYGDPTSFSYQGDTSTSLGLPYEGRGAPLTDIISNGNKTFSEGATTIFISFYVGTVRTTFELTMKLSKGGYATIVGVLLWITLPNMCIDTEQGVSSGLEFLKFMSGAFYSSSVMGKHA